VIAEVRSDAELNLSLEPGDSTLGGGAAPTSRLPTTLIASPTRVSQPSKSSNNSYFIAGNHWAHRGKQGAARPPHRVSGTVLALIAALNRVGAAQFHRRFNNAGHCIIPPRLTSKAAQT
jgi:hypothetical protein